MQIPKDETNDMPVMQRHLVARAQAGGVDTDDDVFEALQTK
ncbi:MAG TPA: hypothetical protein VME42_10435 [Steroidobacteraceae bacterium]|nr:hypothetical protein [Steroidobacteraceae bacterium]